MDSSRTLRQEAQASLQEAHSLSSEANYIRSNASTINQNLNQEFVDWMTKQPYQGKGKVGLDETRRLLSSTDPKHQEMIQHYARDFLNHHKKGFEVSPSKAMGLGNLEGTYQHQSRDVQGHYHQESPSSFNRVQERARESGFLASEKAATTDDRFLQEEDRAERKSKTEAPNPASSRMGPHSSFLDPAETQQKVEELFKDNESSLSAKQKQMEGHKQRLKESVLTGQKRGLIESVSKGPLSHLSELGRKMKEDLKKATDE